MDKPDHIQTANFGSSLEAQLYRKKQKDLIDNNRFDDAVLMDIDDLQNKFGNKYNSSILQMIDKL